MAKIIYWTGKEQMLEDKVFSLKELQTIVHGYIQIMPCGNGDMMVMNEEGKLMNLSPNKKATDIMRENFDGFDDTIVGDVLVCDSKYIE